jgi:hypothetical protein
MVTILFFYGLLNLIIAAYVDLRINQGWKITFRKTDLFIYIVVMLLFGLPVAGVKVVVDGPF